MLWARLYGQTFWLEAWCCTDKAWQILISETLQTSADDWVSFHDSEALEKERPKTASNVCRPATPTFAGKQKKEEEKKKKKEKEAKREKAAELSVHGSRWEWRIRPTTGIVDHSLRLAGGLGVETKEKFDDCGRGEKTRRWGSRRRSPDPMDVSRTGEPSTTHKSAQTTKRRRLLVFVDNGQQFGVIFPFSSMILNCV